MTQTITLYHGTSAENAAALLGAGWHPAAGQSGGNCGQSRCLYLTSEPENALWFAQEKGEETVIAVTVDLADLIPDPEDRVGDTLEEEMAAAQRTGLPFNVAATRPIPASAFQRTGPAPTLRMR